MNTQVKRERIHTLCISLRVFFLTTLLTKKRNNLNQSNLFNVIACLHFRSVFQLCEHHRIITLKKRCLSRILPFIRINSPKMKPVTIVYRNKGESVALLVFHPRHRRPTINTIES